MPANAHLGVVFGSDDPSYLLFDYVVLGNSRDTRLTGEFTTAGWTDRQLGLAGRPPSWTLVVSHAKPRIEVTNHVTATRPLERANSGISGR